MAKVIVQRAWEFGADTLTIEVKVDESFPDTVAEAVRNALNAYAEALEVTVAEPASEDEA